MIYELGNGISYKLAALYCSQMSQHCPGKSNKPLLVLCVETIFFKPKKCRQFPKVTSGTGAQPFDSGWANKIVPKTGRR